MKYPKEFTKEISFPIGGIGTGSIGLDGGGRLIDWEIFNRPSKGSLNGYSHFAIRAINGSEITAAALNGDILKEFTGRYRKSTFNGFGFGPDSNTMCGFPHFKNTEFNGEFPIASISFSDDSFPADVVMTAFNPFIPNDEDNSSIPAAFFEFEIKNTGNTKIKYEIAFSVSNPYDSSINASSEKENAKFLTMYNASAEKSDIKYGDLTIATDNPDSYSQKYWYRGTWMDGIVSFWNEFSSLPVLSNRSYDDAGKLDTCTLIAGVDVEANSAKKIRFVLSWNVPNNYNYWSEYKNPDGTHKTWKNYYATLFSDSAASAEYALKNFESLYARTSQFTNILHGQTLPREVIDAASANLSVLKSPTVLRLEDGSFYGWEGVHENEGSCEGTCQHVWNYAYALCFLFPKLERSIRDLEFRYSTDENGRMAFRMTLPAGREMGSFRACLDGQMGSVLKCYREWKISGDNEWLQNNWENIKKILEYAWSSSNPDKWDLDRDGVLEGRQHHTLDMEMFGPSSWLEGMYLAALKAAAEMGEFLGDTQKSLEYRELFEKGYAWTKENLFNGEYFIQKINLSDKSIIENFDADNYWNSESCQIKYQIGEGSSVDQLLAQWHADIIGLGQIFDKKQLDTALSSMMKNNFKPSMRDFVNPWRIFSLNDEAGTVICDYPDKSKKPSIPIPYCEETMTGFEYSFAGLLFSNGKFDDGLKAVKAVRDRFNGKARNPWNEFECGSNYARSMASFALIPILSGFEFDMPRKYIGFNPYNSDGFSCVWSLDGAWGTFESDKTKSMLTICEGSLTLKSFGIKFAKTVKEVIIDGSKIDFAFKDGILHFDEICINRRIEIIM